MKKQKSPSPLKSKIKKPKPFEWTDHLNTAVEKRAYGHAQAGALLARIIADREVEPMLFLFHLSRLEMYGEAVWYGYKEFCRADVEYFKACVEIEDKNLYNAVMDWQAQQALDTLKEK